ncbi:hypothetical protein SAMN05444395_10945 [Flavobacterium fryxellicola]|uniref:Uncharacterized protein n=1 Tax=Flavobacterium fryxellicola TaxID=249352 RepID=A0A167U768_9FLAO|nr:hypothetical protein [Flavobacterium fryxellicola]OAB25322.1 hypothetical protein FBFR_15170 [Flavobacterium fryxellicola]SHN75138.1 hypothetical protein SAMN05444395_10945 [Flavobacterium fryxellicola]
MSKEELFEKLNDCYDYGDKQGIVVNIEKYQKNVSEEEASRDLAEYIFLKFTTNKADAMAGLMRMMIKDNPNLALLKFPENYFYRLAVIKGSMDLYDCYIEEAIIPFLKDKDEDAVNDCYMELTCVAEKLNDHFFPNYVPCIKGMDFNGAFATYEKDTEISLIRSEDYEIINDVVEKYNTIIGRRDIIKDLYERN